MYVFAISVFSIVNTNVSWICSPAFNSFPSKFLLYIIPFLSSYPEFSFSSKLNPSGNSSFTELTIPSFSPVFCTTIL